VGEAPPKETLVVKATAPVARLAGLRIEALADDSLPHHGPGRAGNGNFALGDIRVTVQTGGDGDAKAKQAKLVNPRATHQQNADVLSIAASIDDDPISGWAVDLGGIGKNQAAAFDVAEPIELSPGAEITVTLSFNHPNTRHAIGRFQLSAAELTGAPADGGKFDPLADARELLLSAKNADDETSAAWQKGMQRFAQVQPEWQKLSQEIAALEKAGPPVTTEKVQVSSEGLPHMPHHADGRGFPHFYPETHFLNRGDVHQKQEVVETGYLRVLERDGKEASFWRVEPPSGWTRTSYRRASLANWITDVDYGAGELAARVIVNRLWQHHFGRGIVATPSDFGFSGERPTHPALLDWMARFLITPEAEGGAGWRLKRLHKLMMTSGVYLQSTQSDEQRATIDRENALLWRRTPQRLEAEPIRDAMLSAAGMLDDTMYGPGTLDPDMRRRSVYFFIKRSQLIPTMMLFDWPEHLVSIGQRSSTTTAPQALMFMNSPQGREYATGLARRMNEAAEPGGETDQAQKLAAIVRRGFRLAYGRLPTESEVAASVEFIHTQAESYQEADKENAVNQAIVDLAQALLSANEFIYVE
jgi:hypothetical protein